MTSSEPRRAARQRWDWQAQVYYYGARFYDPQVARFSALDPVREHMNPYAYVMWRPVMFTDPTGMLMGAGAGDLAGLSAGMQMEAYWNSSAMLQALAALMAFRGVGNGGWTGGGAGGTGFGSVTGSASGEPGAGSGSVAATLAGLALESVMAFLSEKAAEQGGNRTNSAVAVDISIEPGSDPGAGGLLVSGSDVGGQPSFRGASTGGAALGGYVDVSFSKGIGQVRGVPVGVVFGVMIGSDGPYPYVGGGMVGTGTSATFSVYSPSAGLSVAIQATLATGLLPGPTFQAGYTIGAGEFWEAGVGWPAGLGMTSFYAISPQTLRSIL